MKNKKQGHNKVVSEKTFSEVFYSMQLAAVYCLYYNMDFTKQKIKNFNSLLTKHNEEVTKMEIDIDEIEKKIEKMYNFKCYDEAYRFPLRAKMKMIPGKIKQSDMCLVFNKVNEAIEMYLVLAIYTLKKNYKFSGKQITEWWEYVKEFCKLYAEGMNDEHVIKYFEQECDLKITK